MKAEARNSVRCGARARRHGKTKCQNTFNGYECVCGPGYVSQVTKDGKLRCLNVNECKTLDAADLGRDCTCERCACQDVPGSYKCARPLHAASARKNACGRECISSLRRHGGYMRAL